MRAWAVDALGVGHGFVEALVRLFVVLEVVSEAIQVVGSAELGVELGG